MNEVHVREMRLALLDIVFIPCRRQTFKDDLKWKLSKSLFRYCIVGIVAFTSQLTPSILDTLIFWELIGYLETQVSGVDHKFGYLNATWTLLVILLNNLGIT